jgi:hypothetical protein
MFKITAKLVQATNGGVRNLQRGLQTYTRYAYYSLNDRKGQQDGSMSQKPYQPRYSLEYDRPEDLVSSQVGTGITFVEFIEVGRWVVDVTEALPN